MLGGVCGKEYQYAQMGLPRKQVTTLTPSFCAARATVFISSTAQARISSGLPARALGAKLSRRGSQLSPTHWPIRWAPSAHTFSPYFSSVARNCAT